MNLSLRNDEEINMNEALTRLEDLLQRYIQKTLSPSEEQELFDYVLTDSHEEEVKAVLRSLQEKQEAAADINRSTWEPVLQSILAQAQEERALIVPMHKRRNNWKRIAVAASVIGVLFVAGYLIVNRQSSIVDPTHDSPLTTHDVPAPDKNRAQIKLSDGSIVYLDSAANGQLATQSNVTVTKTEDGKIIYAVIPTQEGSAEYNTLLNPRGSKVQPLTLSDGTKVWLNAESSITYPTAFVGNQRKVTIDGEAYFEVAHNASKPFIVSANNKADVTVLGTHFNVNAYEDESDIKVTLVEGSVNVIARSDAGATKQSKSVKLNPGQQAQLNKTGEIKLVANADVVAAVAWKNGTFRFSNDNIEVIMRQLSRWYDVEIVYEGDVKKLDFAGMVPRKENISAVLKFLELTGVVKFRIEGKKVVVMKL